MFFRNLRNLKTLIMLPMVRPLVMTLLLKQTEKPHIPVWIPLVILQNQIFLVTLTQQCLSIAQTMLIILTMGPPRSPMMTSRKESLIWTYPSKPKMRKNSWMCKYLIIRYCVFKENPDSPQNMLLTKNLKFLTQYFWQSFILFG